MRKELGLQAQMPQGGACLAPLGALPPMPCPSVSKISSVPTAALRLFIELGTQALYQTDLHAPAASFRRDYTCTVCPFSENNACTNVFYLLSQTHCTQKPLMQAQARISSILADTQELSSSLALSKGLEILQVASSGSYIKSSAILAQESVQGFRWRDPCQVMPMQWVPLSASQSISVEIP